MRSVMTLVLTLLAMALGTSTSSAADQAVTPATFQRAFAAAQPGDRVVLAAGDYGTFSGGQKAGPVTVVAAPGAKATMSVSFNGSANIRLDGLTITSLNVDGASHDLAFVNSAFTGGAVVRADRLNNANILFDGNTHANINVCGTCYEGRIEVIGTGTSPVGVTIQNSRLGPGGDADGIQVAARGVKILHNEFTNIKQVSATHTDALQLYGASLTTIQSNYFHDFSTAIMAPDGGDHEVITNNVFDGDGSYRPAIQLGSHHGTTFTHNVVRKIDVFMDRKNESTDNSVDGVLRDNVLVNGTINTRAGQVHALQRVLQPVQRLVAGQRDEHDRRRADVRRRRQPVVVGRLRAGLRLQGQGQRQRRHRPRHQHRRRDGRPAGPAPAPSGDGAPAGGAAGTDGTSPSAAPLGVSLDTILPGKPRLTAAKWRYSPSAPRAGQRVVLRAFRTKKAAKGKTCVWTFNFSRKAARHKGCTLVVHFPTAGRKTVTLYVTDKAEQTLAVRTQKISVKRASRR